MHYYFPNLCSKFFIINGLCFFFLFRAERIMHRSLASTSQTIRIFTYIHLKYGFLMTESTTKYSPKNNSVRVNQIAGALLIVLYP